MSLLTSIESFKKYVKVNINSDLKTLQPAIDEAERRYIIPIISQELYALLDEHVNGSGAGEDEKLDALLAQVEIPLASLAYWLHIPSGSVMMDDAGIHVLKTENYQPASQYKTEDLKESYAQTGFDAIDNLLEFLEQNKSDYPEWTESASYTIFHELFISTSKEFSKHYNIGNSRRTFLAIRHIIKHVQETFVKKIIGDELYAEILQQLEDDEESGSGEDILTTPNQTLLSFIRPAIAYLAIADATVELPLEFRNNGIVLNATEGGFENIASKNPAEPSRLSSITIKAKEKGNDYLKRLQLWLIANASAYPLFTPPADTSGNQYFENKSTRKGYFT